MSFFILFFLIKIICLFFYIKKRERERKQAIVFEDLDMQLITIESVSKNYKLDLVTLLEIKSNFFMKLLSNSCF